jgi:hypothetical protein
LLATLRELQEFQPINLLESYKNMKGHKNTESLKKYPNVYYTHRA